MNRAVLLSLSLCVLAAFACNEARDETPSPSLWTKSSFADGETLAVLSTEFHNRFEADIDMLVLFGAERLAPGHSFYRPVRNDTTGVGAALFDQGEDFGSNDALHGVLWMGPDWIDASDEAVLGTLAHETAHRFAAMVSYDDGGKSPATDLTGDPYHWSFFLDSGASPLRGNDWRVVAPGIYEAQPVDTFAYSDLDLYLMGLVSADQVSPVTLLTHPTTADDRPDDRFEPWSNRVDSSTRLYAVPKSVTIDQIIAVHGKRSGFTGHHIRQGWVVVSHDESSEEERKHLLERIERLAPQWESYYTRATRNLGTIEVY